MSRLATDTPDGIRKVKTHFTDVLALGVSDGHLEDLADTLNTPGLTRHARTTCYKSSAIQRSVKKVGKVPQLETGVP